MSIGDEMERRSQRGIERGAEAVWTSAPVQAALTRKRIPLWVMPVLVVVPVWAIIYLGGLSPADTGEPTQLELGGQIYGARCSTCHGPGGGGGPGRPLTDGDVAETFPDLIGQLEFVYRGSKSTGPRDTPYGDPDRPGGQHLVQSFNGSLMPPFGDTLSEAELLAVVRYEREALSGVEIAPEQLDADQNLTWPDGTPMLDSSGNLVTPAGGRLFDDAGNLTIEPDWADPVAGGG